jgi:5-enolpyruvylshikimate-3-phosphate synthase
VSGDLRARLLAPKEVVTDGLRTLRFHEFTRAAYVARMLRETGFKVEYDGDCVVRTDAQRVTVKAIPAGHDYPWSTK